MVLILDYKELHRNVAKVFEPYLGFESMSNNYTEIIMAVANDYFSMSTADVEEILDKVTLYLRDGKGAKYYNEASINILNAIFTVISRFLMLVDNRFILTSISVVGDKLFLHTGASNDNNNAIQSVG